MTIDRQIAIELNSHQGGLDFFYNQKNHHVLTLQKVHEFFRNQAEFDTVKLSHEGQKSYLHFHLDEFEVYDSKQALRKRLSQESGGAWVEEKEGQKRYFIEMQEWLGTTYQELSEKEWLQELEKPSTLQKTLGLGLGLLALGPSGIELAKKLPMRAGEVAYGLMASQCKIPAMTILGYFSMTSRVSAQTVGTEFQVNTFTNASQTLPDVFSSADGSFVITWTSFGQDGDVDGVFARRYGISGMPLSPEFQVNNYTVGNQAYSKGTFLNDGGYVIVWQSQDQDGSGFGIYGQSFNNLNELNGLEFRVNTYTSYDQTHPSIITLIDGRFVVVWQSLNQDTSSWGVYGQVFNEDTSLNGTEFRLNSYVSNYQQAVTAEPLLDGGFIAAWYSNGQDGNSEGVFAQRYYANMNLYGTEFQVNNFNGDWQVDPTIAHLDDGGYVIVWATSILDGSGYGVYQQRYLENGSPTGGQTQVNTYPTLDQRFPKAASLYNGTYVVVWRSYQQDGSEYGIYGQRFSMDAQRVGSEFRVNNYTADSQRSIVLASLNDGGFMTVWMSNIQDGSEWGIFAQRYNRNGDTIPFQNLISGSSHFESTSVESISEQSMSSTAGIENSIGSESSHHSTSSQFSTTSISDTTLENNPSSHSTSSTSSIGRIPALIEVEYILSYPITFNGQEIGTFSITGGEGQFSISNSNTLVIELSVDYQILNGQVITLFSDVPDDLVWDDVVFLNGDGECFDAEGQFVENERGGNDYTLIFEVTSGGCEIVEGSQLAPMAAMLALQ